MWFYVVFGATAERLKHLSKLITSQILLNILTFKKKSIPSLLASLSLSPVYLFLGLMMMYLLLRTFHKMSDVHGLTTMLQLPRCEDSDPDEDREPIVDHGESPQRQTEKGASNHLEPGSQVSYNTINRGWAVRTERKGKEAPSLTNPYVLNHWWNMRTWWADSEFFSFFPLLLVYFLPFQLILKNPLEETLRRIEMSFEK